MIATLYTPDPGGWQYKLILTCVHGKQDLVDADDVEKGTTPEIKAEKTTGPKKLLVCVVGKYLIISNECDILM